ncbi:MAG TPA: hypothetical protein VD931_22785 [Baekduia sp.]|nr:hypothetical protein [Baekduia sp.]
MRNFISIPWLGNRRILMGMAGANDAARHLAGLDWGTNLRATLFHRGKYQGEMDLGSGLVTNVGALAIANEAVTLASPSGARINTLFLANQHFSGKGTTAAAATDIKLETISTVGGETAVAGTQSLVSAANSQKYRTVATISYTGTEAVTEWGLHTSATRTATTGSPFTSSTATTGTTTGTALTASSSTVQGFQQHIFEAATATPVYGFVISNTTSVITIPAWYKVSDGTVGTGPTTEAYTIRPVLWDRKVFSAINVVNGDSIQFTYTLTISSGG